MTRPRELTADSLWKQVSDRLRAALGGLYSTCFADVVGLELSDDSLTLGAPNTFARDWIQERFLAVVQKSASEAAGRPLRVQLRVVEGTTGDEAQEARAVAEPERALSERYTFDTFVIGKSNQFAHAAALAVAESPAQGFNPLVVYGDTGLGKTHLLQAVAHYVSGRAEPIEVRYVTSETFLNEFVAALGDRRRITGFKERYRGYRVLLLDDVHFFARKERIQEEFLHTFDALHAAGSQIVISSDRPPDEIGTLDTGLRSRFKAGLIAEIRPPDLATRIAILRRLARMQRVRLRDPEILPVIAGRITGNVRELEGALTRVIAFSSLMDCPVTVELTQKLLDEVWPQRATAEISIDLVEEVVSNRFGLSVEELRGPRRTANVVYPRQVAMHLARELAGASLPKIGRHFGRDHSTVIHATRRVGDLVRTNRDANDLVKDLTEQIRRR